MIEEAALSSETGGGAKERRCVLIVHGVGMQKKSDTLLYIGSPLVDWVLSWASKFYGKMTAEVGSVVLSFAPFDVGAGDTPAYARLAFGEQEWHFAEAWWAGSNFHPDFGTMLVWSLVHLGDIIAQMVRNTAERARNLWPLQRPDDSTRPAWIWQLVDLVNCVALGVLYAIACVIGYVVLIPLMLLAQIPIESVQNFVLLQILRPALTAGAGEFRVYLDDELQAANVRHRVGAAARWLLDKTGCSELIVVAHSEGCVVSLGMLTDPVYADVAARTRKLLTFGAGLNKSWLIKPTLARLFGPLLGNTLWVDFWASYDPVPAGPLDPTRRVVDGKKYQMTDVYQPDGDALSQVSPAGTPIEEQVTNGMNVLTDHGGYFTNDEQVVLRLASEISSQRHADSAFWPNVEVLRDGVRGRRTRVCALALWRDIAIAFWAISAIGPWWSGAIQGVSPWEPVANIGSLAGFGGAVVGALIFLRDHLPQSLAPVSGVASTVLQLPAFVGLAVLVGVAVWAIYRLVQWLWWERWDKRARADFLTSCVASSRARLASTMPPGSAIVV